MDLTDLLQWIAIVVFVCYARGSAVRESRRQLEEYDERLALAIRRAFGGEKIDGS